MDIKVFPEDFVVDEVINFPVEDKGRFLVFRMEKKGISTLRALDAISNFLKIPLKRFGFAGLKDAKAVTSQVCSVENCSFSQLKKFNHPFIRLILLGFSSRPVSLGLHDFNSFRIVVRNISQLPKFKSVFVNYFGEQRLGRNPEIGKCLIKRDWKSVLSLVGGSGSSLNDVRVLGLRLLRLYVHSYQSFLWNIVAKEYVVKGCSQRLIPLVGFGVKLDGLTIDLLKKEAVSASDFIFREFPDLSSEGDYRTLYSEALNLSISDLTPDEEHIGMKKCVVSFQLGSGCYATEFIHQLFD